VARLEAAAWAPLLGFVVQTGASVPALMSVQPLPYAVQFLQGMFFRRQETVRHCRALDLGMFAWLGLRLDAIAGLACLAAMVTCVLVDMDAGKTGLLLGTALSLGGFLEATIQWTTQLRKHMVPLGRLDRYINHLPQEPPWNLDEARVAHSKAKTAALRRDDSSNTHDEEMGGSSYCKGPESLSIQGPPGDWPKNGRLAWCHVSVDIQTKSKKRHSILENIDVTVPEGSRVGIIGRTGAGKSSMMAVLFRFLEPLSGGRILLDRQDIGRLPLHDVRRAMAFLPQEPVLFAGTVRANLDPIRRYPERDLRTVLDRLYEPGKQPSLDMVLAGGGANLGMGEKQMLCLARALLACYAGDARVLVLDEATAHVDLQTDARVQRALRHFLNFYGNHNEPTLKDPAKVPSGITLLTIAHRLETLQDYDMLIRLDSGRLIEVRPLAKQ
jgi:ABC-type multidrug transport system fused ATPase/permease subunit